MPLSRISAKVGLLMKTNSRPAAGYLRKACTGREPFAPRVARASLSKASRPVCSTRDIRRGFVTIGVPLPDCRQRLCAE